MIKNWKLTVTMTGEPPVVVAVTPRVILDFEREFKVGLVGAMSNEMRLEHMFWLGWKSMHRAGHVVRPRGHRIAGRVRPFGRGTVGRLVAEIAVETGIAPNELLDSPPGMLEAIVEVLNRRAKQQNRGR